MDKKYPKYVYVVMSGYKGDFIIHQVCSSEKKANDKINEISETRAGRIREPWYERWEVK